MGGGRCKELRAHAPDASWVPRLQTLEKSHWLPSSQVQNVTAPHPWSPPGLALPRVGGILPPSGLRTLQGLPPALRQPGGGGVVLPTSTSSRLPEPTAAQATPPPGRSRRLQHGCCCTITADISSSCLIKVVSAKLFRHKVTLFPCNEYFVKGCLETMVSTLFLTELTVCSFVYLHALMDCCHIQWAIIY